MGVEIPRAGTEYVFDPLTFTRGSIADITTAATLHTTDPNATPTLAEFMQPAVIIADASNPLWRGQPEVATKIGARQDALTLAPGDWQRHLRLSTADEDIIRKTGTVTIL